MRTIILFLALTLLACKKEDPEPEPPKPITQANTSFRVRSSGVVYIDFVGGISGRIKNHNKYGDLKPDTTTTMTINVQKIDFELQAGYPTTLTINSGYKSYTFIDSTNQGARSVTLW